MIRVTMSRRQERRLFGQILAFRELVEEDRARPASAELDAVERAELACDLIDLMSQYGFGPNQQIVLADFAVSFSVDPNGAARLHHATIPVITYRERF